MKKIMKAIGITILAGSLLVACNNDDTDGTDKSNEIEQENEDTEDVDESNVGAEGNTSTNEYVDQLDLKLGDTAQVSTNTGEFEITVKSVKREDEIDEENSQLDTFHIVSVEVKNIGSAAIDAGELKGMFEMTDFLEGSGEPEVSNWFESFDALDGEINEGQGLTGEMVYQVYEADTYYLRITDGLVASDAVKNQVTWSFAQDEVQ
ncbi:hypothetical protein AJ85_17285 [Alkalihalobacillus alcalophilus ATCC 27647 = CGMCC 1.3604]|uniref:DUF4352 domain-containing protein n=1 Tax=Alkalihalobacillus alcalophilus ATCC 27647 = CGMCC 1.3604 TaxID=1218173 RepID=A0A094WLX3_ALKAL|nr:DUF4352 domain-containing protein [Alkalihalobacillus alcalophilus]KGA96958.1 hypothetical protein BALCAV_0213115 [Alkalihalobacillus alcalophilus ATCC 27647 = CGMCC 1.3604]MED1561343.1 DUF4352 domain-containing protein [Alkalihalobacillus alcalophilus]THG89508.1 hypothetical protein AJ85_17285 [Alkalihalobacillus alcalophilus ATCC 27647 = CGMCC 1.3604]